MSALSTVLLFITTVFFGSIIFALWLRIALRYLKVSPLNPFSHMVYQLTNPIINPIYSILRQKIRPSSPYDWVSLGVLIVVEFLKIISLSLIVLGQLMPITYLLLYVVADLIIQPCDILFYALLVRVIMSFVNPNWNHPIAGLLMVLTEPLLKIGRKIIPNTSGFDFAPFIMIMILKIVSLAVSNSLPLRLL